MIDFTNVKAVALGGESVKQIARGSDVLWEAGGPEPVGPDYLCFKAEQAGSTLKIVKIGSPQDVSLEYSTDKTVWEPYSIGNLITLSNIGDRVYFRGVNSKFASNASAFHQFVMTGLISASGNIMTIFDGTGQATSFSASYSMPYMFSRCTSLLSAPDILVNSLRTESLTCAFANCTNLASIRVAFTKFTASTNNWMKEVSESGTFYCPEDLDTSIRDGSHVPVGWTVVNV